MALLLVEKIFILAKYLDFINVFSKKVIKIFFKYFEVNNHIIELKNGK